MLENSAHNLVFARLDNEGFEIKREDFESVLNKFSSKSTNSYDFLLKGGLKYKEAMFKLCKHMIEKETFPVNF